MNTAEDDYPLLLHYPYFQLYRKQVVKQADLVLAMYMRPDAFTPEEKARNFAYYEPLTVRDSSLSACTQAVIAAAVGQLELAHDYLAGAAAGAAAGPGPLQPGRQLIRFRSTRSSDVIPCLRPLDRVARSHHTIVL